MAVDINALNQAVADVATTLNDEQDEIQKVIDVLEAAPADFSEQVAALNAVKGRIADNTSALNAALPAVPPPTTQEPANDTPAVDETQV